VVWMTFYPLMRTAYVFLSSLCSVLTALKFHSSSHVPYRSGRKIPDSVTQDTSAMPVSPDGIAVNVHTHSLTSQAIRPDSLGSDMDKQLDEKAHELV
jgi:hypothetical protein